MWGCLTVLLLDLFDKFERRYAEDRIEGDMLSVRRVAWGIIRSAYLPPRRYFVLRLPSYSWEFNPCRRDYCMAQRAVFYITGQGWQLIHTFY